VADGPDAAITILDPQPCSRLEAHRRAARWCLAALPAAKRADAVVLVIEGGVVPSPGYSEAVMASAVEHLRTSGNRSVLLAYGPVAGLGVGDMVRSSRAVVSLMARSALDEGGHLVPARGFDARAYAVTAVGLAALAHRAANAEGDEDEGEGEGEGDEGEDEGEERRTFALWLDRNMPDVACAVPAPFVQGSTLPATLPATAPWRQRVEQRIAVTLEQLQVDYALSLARYHRNLLAALVLVSLFLLIVVVAVVVVPRRALIVGDLVWWAHRVRSRLPAPLAARLFQTPDAPERWAARLPAWLSGRATGDAAKIG
jgi:hypothetical protein